MLFYIGLAINALTLFILLGNVFTMFATVQNLDGSNSASTLGDGMTAFGRLVTWLLPLVLLALMAIAFWLRSSGKLLTANILLWVPALPMLVMVVIWGGLAMLFILFGK